MKDRAISAASMVPYSIFVIAEAYVTIRPYARILTVKAVCLPPRIRVTHLHKLLVDNQSIPGLDCPDLPQEGGGTHEGDFISIDFDPLDLPQSNGFAEIIHDGVVLRSDEDRAHGNATVFRPCPHHLIVRWPLENRWCRVCCVRPQREPHWQQDPAQDTLHSTRAHRSSCIQSRKEYAMKIEKVLTPCGPFLCSQGPSMTAIQTQHGTPAMPPPRGAAEPRRPNPEPSMSFNYLPIRSSAAHMVTDTAIPPAS